MPVIGARLGDDIDHRAAGAPELGAVGVGRDAKFLHDFGRKLIGSTVASTGLREEGIVEVAAIDEEAVVESAQAAER
jgi:hypothetical protein